MGRIRIAAAVLVWAVLGAAGCSGIQVSQDYGKGADFSGVSSFAWASDTQEKTGDVRVDNPLMIRRIREAVEQTLIEKGMRKADRSEAGILVQYHYEIRQKVRSDDVRGGFGFGAGTWGRSGGIVIGTGGEVQTYDEALLVVDLLRPNESDLLWRGNATYRLAEHSSPEKTTQRVNQAVEKIFAQFPPAPETG